ncbi:MAG TPA: LacI family DNA-binding transcriptional regulator, partial [Spirochaetia bacterium]|nr:LacI family DNA-binding transcriptional regulator [Spirochaetia bacterium]
MTIKDIARLAGVTHSTVSRCLNDSPLVSEATKERVKRIAAENGYSPNAFARRLVTKKSHTLGVFFLSRDEIRLQENFGTQFLDGIAQESHKRGYDLLFFTTTSDRTNEKSYMRLCREKHVEGVIFIGMTSDDPHLAEIAASEIPVCVIDFPVEGALVSCVTSDNDRGVRQALDYLHGLGHRDIGFLSGPAVSPVAMVREDTYRSWMEERGLSPLARVWEGAFTK